MPRKAHSAIDRYKARRAGRIVADLTTEERQAIRENLNPSSDPDETTAGADRSETGSRNRPFRPYRESRGPGLKRRLFLLAGLALALVAAAALALAGGCTPPDGAELGTFVREAWLNAAAAFLF